MPFDQQPLAAFVAVKSSSRRICFVFGAALVSLILAAPPAASAASCESLRQLKLEHTTVVSAQEVAAGSFSNPSPQPNPLENANFAAMPAFCRVVLQGKPSPDSDLKIEVWLPLSGWNGRYRGQGNGGFAGSIAYAAMAGALSAGYATAGTNTGHDGVATDATWAVGHPEKVVDFGFRGIHEMTLRAKEVVQAFYGHGPQHSYFASCSDGGREALMEAQRFPRDYDGIVAGAPANFWTHLVTAAAWDMQATEKDSASYIPASKMPALDAAVNAACDSKDGVSDGILNDPRECRFDPATLLCKGADSDSCLTAAQVAALRKIYEGTHDSKGRAIFPGFPPGGEAGPGGWSLWITGKSPGTSLQYLFGTGFFADMVFEQPGLDVHKIDIDKAVAAADQKLERVLNATDPNLKPFQSGGGKLILYHGWNDAAIPALSTIQYYDHVVSAMSKRQADAFMRLYMVPGLQHCGGGPGANSFGQLALFPPADAQHDVQKAVEQWVETGAAPSEIIATKYADDLNPRQGVKMTRPLCPYPLAARYKGTGDTADAASFECTGGRK